MADQTILALLDVSIIHSQGNQEGVGSISVFPSGSGDETNLLLKFNVLSLAGMVWDSVVLKMTYGAIQTSFTTGPVFIGRVLKRPVNYAVCTDVLFDTGLSWDSQMAEGSGDNDHNTRVNTFSTIVQGSRALGDPFVSVDLTNLIVDGVTKDKGTLNIIMYAPNAATASGNMAFYSIEGVGAQAELFFENVQFVTPETEEPSGEGTATNVAVPSASSLSKSGRPPIAGADRQYSATILHDGVEPMNILSITLRGTFGADN